MRAREALLDPATDELQLATACRDLYDLLRAATPEATLAIAAGDVDAQLEGGIALSPSDAGTCLLDARRTAGLLRGVFAAIRAAVDRTAGRTIEVVYAGTGPFAPLAVLLMSDFTPADVQFTLIDSDRRSTVSVQSLVEHLGLSAHVKAIIRADAARYVHPNPIDVIVSETMQRALAHEPFVAILRNLRPQLIAGGAIVPERVTVELALVEPAAERARWAGEAVEDAAEHVATVFDISAGAEVPSRGAAVPVRLSPPQRSEAKWLALITRITIFGSEILAPYASGLTMPEILWPLSPLTSEMTLAFRYEDGPNPGIRWSRTEPFHPPAAAVSHDV